MPMENNIECTHTVENQCNKRFVESMQKLIEARIMEGFHQYMTKHLSCLEKDTTSGFTQPIQSKVFLNLVA